MRWQGKTSEWLRVRDSNPKRLGSWGRAPGRCNPALASEFPDSIGLNHLQLESWSVVELEEYVFALLGAELVSLTIQVCDESFRQEVAKTGVAFGVPFHRRVLGKSFTMKYMPIESFFTVLHPVSRPFVLVAKHPLFGHPIEREQTVFRLRK